MVVFRGNRYARATLIRWLAQCNLISGLRRDTAAENALTDLQATHGRNLIKHVIRKDRPSSRRSGSAKADGKNSTYTLRYFIRQAETRRLF